MESYTKIQSKNGRKGGRTTKKLYGIAHYKKIGEEGRKARSAKNKKK